MIPVLELIVSTRPGGGPEHVRALAGGLGARGFTAIVGAPRDGAVFDRLREDGVDVVEIATNRIAPAALARVVALARARGARVIHSHGKGAGLYGRLAARALGVPAVHTFHGIHYERYGRILGAAYLALERTLARSTAIVLNVSRAQEAEGLALRLFSARQSRVVPNGVDIARLEAQAMTRDEARQRLAVAREARIVGTVARFDRVKGLDLLLRAVARVPTAMLVIIGDGAERDRLAQLAADLGLGSRARFAGEITDAARLYRAFDVFATASAKEGLPLAVLEAMAVGLPVVASDIAAHREVLADDARALVPRTAAAFGEVLDRVLADGPLRGSLASANLARAKAEYDVGRMLEGVAEAYRAALRL